MTLFRLWPAILSATALFAGAPASAAVDGPALYKEHCAKCHADVRDEYLSSVHGMEVSGAMLGRNCHVGRNVAVGAGAVLGDKTVLTDYTRT